MECWLLVSDMLALSGPKVIGLQYSVAGACIHSERALSWFANVLGTIRPGTFVVVECFTPIYVNRKVAPGYQRDSRSELQSLHLFTGDFRG